MTEKIPEKEWKKVYLPIPKRKHKSCRIYVSEITLPKCTLPVKQIIVKDHGRALPTFVITNNRDLKLEDILMVYAKRWHIEQKFAELVAFFNLNALSSPLMIRIHFDILWTVIAAKYGYTKQDIQYNACINVNIGTWILSQKMYDEVQLWRGVGDYHSHTQVFNQRYSQTVYAYHEKIEQALEQSSGK